MNWERRTLGSGITCLWVDTPLDRPNPLHWDILEQSTALIPEAHRTAVSTIELRGHRQVPLSGGGSIHTTSTIRLSYASLRETYNDQYNVTLLHEFGHHVDWRYEVTSFVRRQGANGRTLIATGHTGATQGDGERIADCYMIYLIQVIAAKAYTHPADPAAYRGDAAQMRFDLLLQSPAFAGVVD